MEAGIIAIRQHPRVQQERGRRDELLLVVIQLARQRTNEKHEQDGEERSRHHNDLEFSVGQEPSPNSDWMRCLHPCAASSLGHAERYFSSG